MGMNSVQDDLKLMAVRDVKELQKHRRTDIVSYCGIRVKSHITEPKQRGYLTMNYQFFLNSGNKRDFIKC